MVYTIAMPYINVADNLLFYIGLYNQIVGGYINYLLYIMIFEIVYLSNCGFIILNYVRMQTVVFVMFLICNLQQLPEKSLR